jgi:hypothetical protein
VAIGLPPFWAAFDTPWLGSSYPPYYQRFELLGLTGTLALFALGAFELRGRIGRRIPWQQAAAVLIPLLTGLYFVTLVSEYSQRSYDYGAYQNAASRLLAGEGLYDGKPPYLYPPLTAQALAALYRWVDAAPELTGRVHHRPGMENLEFTAEKDVWNSVFYYYRCLLLLGVALAYYASYAFVRRLGMAVELAHLLVAAILVFDNPLFRTLRWNQVNLWLLDLSLLGLLWAQRRPILAGFSIALAANVKVYPLVLWGALTAARFWLVSVATLAGLGLVVATQTDFFRDGAHWQGFFAFLPNFPWEHNLRNNNFFGIVYNLLRLGAGVDPSEVWVRGVAVVLTSAASAWFAWRFVQREASFRRGDRLRVGASPDGVRLFGHGADALAFGLVAATSVWEHHYVLAIPLALYAVALWGTQRPWSVAIGILLAIVLPSFDVFPLSYHRIAGLMLLLWVTSPPALRAESDAPTRSG